MLFGCGTWSMNKEMERSIDSFNRRMVRHASGIFWLKRMSTEEVNVLIKPTTREIKITTLADARPHFAYGRPCSGKKKQPSMPLKPKKKN